MNFLNRAQSPLSSLLSRRTTVVASSLTSISKTPIPPRYHPSRINSYTSIPFEVHRSHLHRSGSRWYHNRRNVTMAAVGAIVGIYLGNLEVVPYSNRTHFVFLSSELERKLGDLMWRNTKRDFGEYILPPSDPYSVCVEAVSSRMIQALKHNLDDTECSSEKYLQGWGPQINMSFLKEIKWEVIVVRDNRINASCMPGGKIMVYTGMLDYLSNEEEFAAIFGHAMGHAIARHTAEFITFDLAYVVLQLLVLLVFDITRLMHPIKDLLSHLPISRKMETEADHIGLMLLAAAGYDPCIAPRVQQKLGYLGAEEHFFSTHPSGEQRAELLSRPHVMDEALKLYTEVIAGSGVLGSFTN